MHPQPTNKRRWKYTSGETLSYMAQRSVLTQTTQPEEATPQKTTYRWMRHFFSEDVSPDNRPVIDLQRRATWIAVALILQSLNEIDHDWYFPALQPFGSLIPFF